MNKIIFFLFLTLFLTALISSCSPTSNNEEGKVLVETTPQNAKVFLNDKFIGITPFITKLRSNSKVSLTFDKQGYFPYKETVNFTNQSFLSYQLIPQNKAFTFRIKPFPDKLFINQQPVKWKRNGISAVVNLNIPFGNYQVLALKENRPFLFYEFELVADSPKQVNLAFKASDARNKLVIRSPLEEVQVFYRGINIGILPMTLTKLKNIIFQLSFHKDNYEDKTVSFSLAKNEYRAVNIRLLPLDNSFAIRFVGLPPNHRVRINKRVVIPVEGKVKVEFTDRTIYQYRIDALGYYPLLAEFIHSNQNNQPSKTITKQIEVSLTKIISKPTIIRQIALKDEVLTARLNGKQNGEQKLFISDVKNQLTVYNQILEPISHFDFKEIAPNDMPQLSYGFLEDGIFLLANGLLRKNFYFKGNNKFSQPVYLLKGENEVLVFNNGNHQINRWRLDNLSKPEKLIQTISGYDYIEDEHLYQLRFGQAIWSSSISGEADSNNIFYFTDPLNGSVKRYNLREERGETLELESNPLQPYAIASYKEYLFISSKNKIFVYLIDGELVDTLEFPEIKDDILFSFIINNKLILINKSNVFLYQI